MNLADAVLLPVVLADLLETLADTALAALAAILAAAKVADVYSAVDVDVCSAVAEVVCSEELELAELAEQGWDASVFWLVLQLQSLLVPATTMMTVAHRLSRNSHG